MSAVLIPWHDLESPFDAARVEAVLLVPIMQCAEEARLDNQIHT